MPGNWTDAATAVGTLVTVLVTLLVGLAAWWVSKQSSKIAAASIVPLLQVRENILDHELEYTLVNWGLGPAIVNSIQVHYPPVPYLVTECMEWCPHQQQQQQQVCGRLAAGTSAGDIENAAQHQAKQPEPPAPQDWAKGELGPDNLDMLATNYKDRYGMSFQFSSSINSHSSSSNSDSRAKGNHFQVLATNHLQWRKLCEQCCKNVRKQDGTAQGNIVKTLDHEAKLLPGPLLTLKQTKHIDFRQTPLGPWLRNAVGFNNVKDGDFRLLYAKSMRDEAEFSAAEWQLGKMVILGHLSGIRLVIEYTDAMGKSPCNSPLDYTFQYSFDKNTLEILRGKLLPSQPSQQSGSSSNSA